jgi:hypothetical protein
MQGGHMQGGHMQGGQGPMFQDADGDGTCDHMQTSSSD